MRCASEDNVSSLLIKKLDICNTFAKQIAELSEPRELQEQLFLVLVVLRVLEEHAWSDFVWQKYVHFFI